MKSKETILEYSSFGLGYNFSSYCYNVFSTDFSDPYPLGVSFSFILFSLFHLHPSRVGQVTGLDPCPINTFLKSLGVVVRLKFTVQVSLPH